MSFIKKSSNFAQQKSNNIMLVNAKTKISHLIKHDKKAIDAIASINPHFRKLKNPILRKLLAPRVNVSDAARIGGVTANEFLHKLSLYGFDIEFNKDECDTDNTPCEKECKDNIKCINIMKRTNIVELDVRPILEGGVDPFEAIMGKLKQMSDDQTLLIINTFEPVPLLNILKKKGYDFEVERPEPGIVHTYMKKADTFSRDDVITDVESANDNKFDLIEKKYAGQMKEVDVRDLEMPMPMVTILEELEHIDSSNALYVHHKKLPQYLLPEIADRGYSYVHKDIDENNLKLIIYK